MDSNEILAEAKKIRSELMEHPKGQFRMKYRNFLLRFGLQRRMPAKLHEIHKKLRRQKVEISFSEEGVSLLDIPFEKQITLRLRVETFDEPPLEKTPNPTAETRSGRVAYAGTINVAEGKCPKELYPHQIKAMKELEKRIVRENPKTFAGLVVLPTGGGKTHTASQWLVKHGLDQNRKVLWLAHRHALLDQAQSGFAANAYRNIAKTREGFNFRILSGVHDKPVHIRPTDDLLIASTGSLSSETGFEYLKRNWLSHHRDELFLVVDEAHHAVAASYRKIIDRVRKEVRNLRVIGLTATPQRTAANEQGWLKKVFPDDIVYSVSLRSLISQGILAEPIFEYPRTRIDMTQFFDEKELAQLRRGFKDIDSIGEATAKTIAENKERNSFIVRQYLDNRTRYRQTLVFALNQDNAIALNKIFRNAGVKSDYVISSVRDAFTGVTLSPRENERKVRQFPEGELDVLINVNILTEGTDLPAVQTVFLARPTNSSILMTQMIGRALRGVKAGGTERAYVVSFIDNWNDKITWVNPEQLYCEEDSAAFPENSSEYQKKLVRMISISKIEEFAEMMDDSLKGEELARLDFIQRVPVGIYSFTLLLEDADEDDEKPCQIVVYDNLSAPYARFLDDLPTLFKNNGLAVGVQPDSKKLNRLADEMEKKYFSKTESRTFFQREDVRNVLEFFSRTGEKPAFFEFKDRKKFDLANVAATIYKQELGGARKTRFIQDVWEREENGWKAFFGFNQSFFVRALNKELEKLEFPEHFKKAETAPRVALEEREFWRMSLSEIEQHDPEYAKRLRDQVFQDAMDDAGYFVCAKDGYRSKNRGHFHVDHKIPLSKGGLTVPQNLQLLKSSENLRKGNR